MTDHPSTWNAWPTGGDLPPAGAQLLTRLPPETYSVVRLSDGVPLAHLPRTEDGRRRAFRYARAVGCQTRVVESVTRRRVSAARPNFAQVVRSRDRVPDWSGEIDWRVVG